MSTGTTLGDGWLSGDQDPVAEAQDWNDLPATQCELPGLAALSVTTTSHSSPKPDTQAVASQVVELNAAKGVGAKQTECVGTKEFCGNCCQTGHFQHDCPNPAYCRTCKAEGHTIRGCISSIQYPLCTRCYEPSHEGECQKTITANNRLMTPLSQLIEANSNTDPDAYFNMIKQTRTTADAMYWVQVWMADTASDSKKSHIMRLYSQMATDRECPWLLIAASYKSSFKAQVLTMDGKAADYYIVVAQKICEPSDNNMENPITRFRSFLTGYPETAAENKTRFNDAEVGFVFGKN